MKTIWIAYSIMWLSVALAISVAIHYTNSPLCLFAFVIPASLKVESKKD